MSLLTQRLKLALTRHPWLYERARMPYATFRFLLRRPHEPEFAAFALFPERRGLFLDVGANAGMSALSFRIFCRRNPILSIEPNPLHEKDLAYVGRLVRRFEYRLFAAGAENGSLTLHTPVFRGTPLTPFSAVTSRQAVEEHGFLRNYLGDRAHSSEFLIVSQEVPVRRLDDFGLMPDFIKIDVEEYEHEVLLGLRETLARTHPVLLLEGPTAETRELLAEFGYHPFLYDGETRSLRKEDQEEVPGSRTTDQTIGPPNVIFAA